MNSLSKIRSGLLSITFRQKSVSEILSLAHRAKLDGIEWGSDIHVKPGDVVIAEKVREESKQLGLEVLSYASYYRAGVSTPSDFDLVLQSAQILGTNRIRVWAGDKNADIMPSDEKRRVMDDLLRISSMAKAVGIEIGTEYHNHTLTHTANSTRDLFVGLADSNIFSYWQPPVMSELDQNAKEIEMLGKWIKMSHVYYWTGDYTTLNKHLLQEGEKEWKSYFQALSRFTAVDSAALEFVKDDAVESFVSDAEELKRFLKTDA
ncbi:MAG: TIM barrel protein [Verrucomicrobiota bacterium]